MKDQICKAFCDEIQVHEVPAGLAVSTGFSNFLDDPIGFYVTGPDDFNRYRIQDDGLTVWHLESAGADLDISSRAEAFHDLLGEYGFIYNENESTLASQSLEEREVASSALRFVALLLRLQDLLLLVQERVASTFKEEAMRRLAEQIGNQAQIAENEALIQSLTEFPADVVFRPPNRNPVALFFGTSDLRVSEAIMLDMAARFEANIDCSVVALIEKDTSISSKYRQRASNRLAAVPYYEGDEQAAIDRVVREVLGTTSSELH